MDINVIGVPLSYGCDRDGANLGPGTLREKGIIDIIKKNGHNVHDMGDIHVPSIGVELKYADHPKMKYLNTVTEINTNLANNVYCSLKGQGFPFVIGGDHALGMGSIAGASKFFKELAVIWVDAHGDINTFETSPSGNIHGMPLAASMNVGHPTLTNIYFDGQKVKPENVYILGGRDIDPGEFALADELNLNMYTIEVVRERGLDNVLEEIIEKIKASDVDGVHLSFDIDVLDSSLVPGTGTPVTEGFSMEEGKSVFTSLLGGKFVTSMDFVELNPLIDNEDKRTVKHCMEMLEHIFKTID
ncbi:arginase [Tissierella sp.]|uniref:arginase n=1 Tax=Tissierella sp. TaxID=41274 RepID=UPI002855A0D1|nr:arginase [Tissierella sp.]MDR7855594.1 arginase [Tissierella sp.]